MNEPDFISTSMPSDFAMECLLASGCTSAARRGLDLLAMGIPKDPKRDLECVISELMVALHAAEKARKLLEAGTADQSKAAD